jgi:hypothetical protein
MVYVLDTSCTSANTVIALSKQISFHEKLRQKTPSIAQMSVLLIHVALPGSQNAVVSRLQRRSQAESFQTDLTGIYFSSTLKYVLSNKQLKSSRSYIYGHPVRISCLWELFLPVLHRPTFQSPWTGTTIWQNTLVFKCVSARTCVWVGECGCGWAYLCACMHVCEGVIIPIN